MGPIADHHSSLLTTSAQRKYFARPVSGPTTIQPKKIALRYQAFIKGSSEVKSSSRGAPQTSGGVGLSYSRVQIRRWKLISMKKTITVIATSLCFAFVAGATDVPQSE